MENNMKVAYVIDSASFLSQEEAKELGLYYLPLYIMIDNEAYQEGVNLDRDVLYTALENKKSVSTSQASIGEMTDLINQLKSDGYDCAIFSGIGSGLSKTQDTFALVGKNEDYDVHIIDSKSVGYAQLNSLLKVREAVDKGIGIKEAIESVQQDIEESKTVIVVGDLDQLVKSGRLKAGVAVFANMLQIKLVLQLDKEQGGKIELVDKVRTAKKAYRRMIDIIFSGIKNLDEYVVLLADFKADEAKQYILEEIKKLYPNLDVINKPLIPTVGSHSGLNTVGIQIAKK
jgi:DegV family protein with EDD domain